MDESLFKKTIQPIAGIYYCLSESVHHDDIKKVEMETCSIRSHEFDEASMLALPPAEVRALEPFRCLPREATIVELGGGDGRFAFQLMREGYQVIESDIAPGSVKKV